jgi:hypothetical protein
MPGVMLLSCTRKRRDSTRKPDRGECPVPRAGELKLLTLPFVAETAEPQLRQTPFLDRQDILASGRWPGPPRSLRNCFTVEATSSAICRQDEKTLALTLEAA